jgi:diketogulonate reductase-like aldo/keto reductase
VSNFQPAHLFQPAQVTTSRIRENLAVFDFDLDEDDLGRLPTMERGMRTGPNPDTFT